MAAGIATACGFSLIELLVVVGLSGVLIALLVPSLASTRTVAQVMSVNSDLRQIRQALELYQLDWRGNLPPSRFSCDTRSAYELPEELAGEQYLPGDESGAVLRVDFVDRFSPTAQTYAYRAPGDAIINEFTLHIHGSSLFIPTNFPNFDGEAGSYAFDPRRSPVQYAIWSIGPDVNSPKLVNNFGRAPMLSRFWLGTGVGSDRRGGVIAWIVPRTGSDILSTP